MIHLLLGDKYRIYDIVLRQNRQMECIDSVATGFPMTVDRRAACIPRDIHVERHLLDNTTFLIFPVIERRAVEADSIYLRPVEFMTGGFIGQVERIDRVTSVTRGMTLIVVGTAGTQLHVRFAVTVSRPTIILMNGVMTTLVVMQHTPVNVLHREVIRLRHQDCQLVDRVAASALTIRAGASLHCIAEHTF